MAKLFAPLQSWLQERNRPLPDASEVDYEPVVTDATPEALLAVMAAYKGRAVVYTDEGSIADILSGALYGKPGGRTNIDLFLKAYDGSAIACYRKNAVSNIMLDEVHLAVTIGMQPCVLDEFARNPTLASRGLPQRMLFYKPVSLTNVNVIDAPEEPTEELEAWAEKICHLAALHRAGELVMPFAPEALSVFDAFRQSMSDRKTADLGENESIRAYAAKAPDKVARLAGILALLQDADAATIPASAVEAAVGIMNEYFLPQAQQIFCGVKMLSPQATAVLKALQAMTATDDMVADAALYRRLSGQKQFKHADGRERYTKALHLLASLNMIRHVAAPANATGRPGNGFYEVHPDLLEHWRASAR